MLPAPTTRLRFREMTEGDLDNYTEIRELIEVPTVGRVTELATEEQLEAFRAQYGLDQPLLQQFFTYVKNTLQFDLGISLRYRVPVSELILDRLWPTLLLVGLSRVGILSSARLRSARRFVILGIAIFAAVATPGGDLVSPFVLGGTMYLLFELTVLFIKRSGR